MRAYPLLRWLALLACVFWASVALAQTPPLSVNDPVYGFWNDVAENAERTLDKGSRATTDELIALRKRMVTFRNEFDNQRNVNQDRIRNLESQLEALGPVPETGEEATEIAEKREQLRQQLESVRAPVRVADVAFRRADGLIGEIDAVLRDRQARRLLQLGPSPLDPRTWPVALTDMVRILGDIGEAAGEAASQRNIDRLKNRLPLMIVLIAVAGALIFRGRNWVATGIDYLRRYGGRGTGVWEFLASLLRILVPLSGVYLFTYSIRLGDVVQPKVDEILSLLPIWGGFILGYYWLGERLMSRNDEDVLIPLPAAKRARARFYLLMLSVFLVARGVLEVVFDLEQAEPETVALVAFPVVVLAAAALFLIGGLLRKRAIIEEHAEAEEDVDHTGGLLRIVRIGGTFMVVIAIVAPTMAGIGYAEAGNALLYPAAVSVGLFGFILVLQRFLTDVYGLFSGQGVAARESLTSVLIGIALITLSLPILALIWGARVTDLAELWQQFMQGFEIGGTRISPSSFMIFAIVFAIGYTTTRLVQSTLRQNVLPKTRLDIGGQNALVSGIGYLGIFLAALVAVTVAGLDLSGLAIVAGALSVGIGFGLQTIVSNFVSGIILLIERPISEGDWIEVGGQMGYVKHISVRSTRIETFDRTDVIVPNSDLVSGTVTNYTRGNTIGRLIVQVGVAYGTDTKKVDKILREIAEAQPLVLRKPPPNVVFMGFGADALDFEIRAILRDVNWMLSVKNDINHEIAARFAEEGIEIPFAQRDIWLRNPEALRSDRPVAVPEPADDVTYERPEAQPDIDIPADDGADPDGSDK